MKSIVLDKRSIGAEDEKLLLCCFEGSSTDGLCDQGQTVTFYEPLDHIHH